MAIQKWRFIHNECVWVLVFMCVVYCCLLLFSSLSHTFFRTWFFYSVLSISLCCLSFTTLMLDLFEFLDSRFQAIYTQTRCERVCVRACLCVFLFMHTSILLCTFISVSIGSVFLHFIRRPYVYECSFVVYTVFFLFFFYCLTYVTRYILHECAIAGATSSCAVVASTVTQEQQTNQSNVERRSSKKRRFFKANPQHRDFCAPHSHSLLHTGTSTARQIDTIW